MKKLKTFENWTGSIEGFGNKAEAEMRRSGEEIMRKAREAAERRKAEENKCNCDNCDCENCDEEGCDCGCCCEPTNEEKSVSKSQQRLMGQAYAYKTGELKAKDLNPDYADEIKDLAKSMTKKQLEDFAKTKHKGLPQKVKEGIMSFQSFNESKTTYKDIERFLYKSYRENPTDDDAELAERAIMNPDFRDVAEEMEDNEWPFTIANQIIRGDFY